MRLPDFGQLQVGMTAAEAEQVLGSAEFYDLGGGQWSYVACDLAHAALLTFDSVGALTDMQ